MRNEHGYTLVELLTVLTIFGTIAGGITGVFVSATNSEIQSNRRFQAQGSARLAVDKLRREVHCATSATVVGTSLVTLNIGNSTCKGYPTVSWCVAGAGTRYALYRQSGSVCSAVGGTKFADYLLSSSGFVYESATTQLLARLQVTFAVNTRPSVGHETYTLRDKLTLRNSQRL